MAGDSNNPTDSEFKTKIEAVPRELTIWDNTPEEEQREIEALMDMACEDLEASLPPYDWGDDLPEV